MKILYWKTGDYTNDVFFAKYNYEFKTPYRVDNGDYYLLKSDGSDNTHVPAGLLSTNEVEPDDFLQMADLKRTIGKYDSNGRSKYYVDTGVLTERDGWEEAR